MFLRSYQENKILAEELKELNLRQSASAASRVQLICRQSADPKNSTELHPQATRPQSARHWSAFNHSIR